MKAWCLGCGERRPDAEPDSPLTSRSCPHCHGPYAIKLGDPPTLGALNHAVRATDVPPLLPKVIG